MMRCVKTEKRREGRKHLQIWLSLHNEAIWWHKSVVSEVFLQALLFISYICKVPENVLVTLNHNHLLLRPAPLLFHGWVFFCLCFIFSRFRCAGEWGATRDHCKAPSVTLMNKKGNLDNLPVIFPLGLLVLGLGSRETG